jgi:hypothetical protein
MAFSCQLEHKTRAPNRWGRGGEGSGGLFGVGHGIEELKKVLDAGDLQGLVDALIDADEEEGASTILAGDVGSDQGAYSGRIGEGDGGEVKDEGAGVIGANLGLEAKDIGKYQGSGEANDTDSFFGTGNFFDLERQFGHEGDVNGQ